MTLTQLKHLVALAQWGSFAQTAKAVFLTQPALTRSIQSLEDELGGKLFDRMGRRIGLTPFGQEVLQRARLLVSDADALKRLGAGLDQGLTGKLRMGLGSGPGLLFSGVMMSHMAIQHPRLQLSLSRGNTETLLRALKEQELDAAVIDVRAMRPSSDFEVTHTFEMQGAFMVRAGHPLLKRKSVSLENIKVFPIASTPLSDEVARMLMATYGPQANPDDLVTLRSDETSHIVEVARQSDAVVLSIVAAGPDLRILNMKPELKATAKFGLVTLAKRQPAPALRIVHEQLPGWIAALQSA
jgi:DNA-binding transcriptional LysR family regulator